MAFYDSEGSKRRVALVALAAVLFLVVLYQLFIAREAPLAAVRTSYNAKAKAEVQYDALEHCDTPFGTVLGYAMGQPAFSNCNRDFKATDSAIVLRGQPHYFPKFMSNSGKEVLTGAKWRDIDFVQRLLLQTKSLQLFGEAESAQQLWGASSFRNPFSRTGRYFEIVKVGNYHTDPTPKERRRAVPAVLDLIFYADQPHLVGGHVAAVVDVQEDVAAAGGEAALEALKAERREPYKVFVADQNFRSVSWEGRNYSRVLTFSWQGNDGVLKDPSGMSVLGFIRKGALQDADEEEDHHDL